jgi:hypothetical protein
MQAAVGMSAGESPGHDDARDLVWQLKHGDTSAFETLTGEETKRQAGRYCAGPLRILGRSIRTNCDCRERQEVSESPYSGVLMSRCTLRGHSHRSTGRRTDRALPRGDREESWCINLPPIGGHRICVRYGTPVQPPLA